MKNNNDQEFLDSRQISTDLNIDNIDSEAEDYRSTPSEFNITSYPADFTLEILVSKLQSEEILIPDFQRQFVWKQPQASRLIESFLAGLPVPPIFLYKEYSSNRFLLIDGQQRLKTVKYFFEGMFGEESKGKRKIFRLNSLSSQSSWYSKSFETLDEKDKRELLNRVLRAIIIQQIDPKDDSSIYHIFERLNTGGTFLNNQEIRNCLYYGDFNTLVRDNLNIDPNYRKILGKESKDPRLLDEELIIRFFSLLDVNTYNKPLKDHLSRFMNNFRSPGFEKLDEFSSLFTKTCATVIQHLGPKPFHIHKGINVAAFDCVMVAFAHNLKREIPLEIVSRYKNLIETLIQRNLITASTTDKEVILQRFQLAQEVLFE